MDKNISVEKLKLMIVENQDFILLDVRELPELNICKLEYTEHIPMGQLPNNLAKLDKSKTIVVYCRSGGRSGACVDYLLGQGFKDVFNLEGGILAWAEKIDRSLAIY